MVYIFINLFISSIFSIISGYQLIKLSFIKKELDPIEAGLFGFIFLGILSLFANFFLALDPNINSVIISIFISLFIFQIKNNFNRGKEILISSLKISLIALIFLVFSNNFDPDSFLYHLPYSNLINDYKILPGAGLIHFRFGTISIMQYINALFNNHIFGPSGITIPTSLVFSLFFLFLLNKITEILKNKSLFSLYNFFILCSFIFLCLRMNRYSDYGNDHIVTIFFLYFISIFIKKFDAFDINDKKYLTLLACFIFTLKVFYFAPLILCLYLWIPKINFKIINFSNVLCLFFLLLWFIKNILISGCIIYPVSFTCINKLPWYNLNNKNFVNAKQISLSGEAWAKNWNTYNTKQKSLGIEKDKFESQEEYIKNFFWLNEWIMDHGKLILKKLFPFVSFIIILYILNRKKIKNIQLEKNNKLFFLLLFINSIALSLWFLKFPIMRYGLAYIFTQIFLISFIFFKDRFSLNIKFIFVLSLFILISKNLIRISENYNTSLYPEIEKQNKYLYINKNKLKIYYTRDLCGYKNSPCTSYKENINNIEVKKFYNYKYISLIN